MRLLAEPVATPCRKSPDRSEKSFWSCSSFGGKFVEILSVYSEGKVAIDRRQKTSLCRVIDCFIELNYLERGIFEALDQCFQSF